MILSLALLAACGDAALDAPDSSASAAKVLTTTSRLSALEAQTALLTKQMRAAQAQITALQTENKNQTATIQALTQDNAIHVANLGALNNQISALVVSEAYSAAIASASLDYLLKAAGGPGRQGGHITLVEDYQAKLAEAGVTPVTGADVDALRGELFETDPDSGATEMRVTGIGGRTAGLLGKARGAVRGTLRTAVGADPNAAMYLEWETLIDGMVADIVNNPLHSDDTPNTNPLFDIQARVDGFTHFVDDWQGEVSALKATDDFLNGQVVYMKSIQAAHSDYVLGLAGAKAPSSEPKADELRALLFSVGTPVVSDAAIEKPWIKNMEKKFPDVWSTWIKPEVSVLVADADKRREAGDLTVAANASREVKELADILKADYAKQVGDVQTDVDALWLDMLAGDQALQTQISELDAEVCALGEVVAGQWLGDDAMAQEAWLTLNGDGRFLACLAR
jgi:hypothetical protein